VHPLVQQLVVHRRRGLIGEVLAVQYRPHCRTLVLAQRPRLRLGCAFRPLHRWWGRGLAMPPVVTGLRRSGGPARRPLTAQRRHRGHGVINHRAGSLPLFWLSVASCSNSAESFPWTSITRRALSNSASSRSTCRRSFVFSRSTGSAGGRPVGFAKAANAAWSRWARPAQTNGE